MSATSFNLTSKQVSNRLDSDIIQLVKVVSIEQQISIEEAKNIVRLSIQRKLNDLYSDIEIEGINNLINNTKSCLKNNKVPNLEYISKIYELFKTVGLI